MMLHIIEGLNVSAIAICLMLIAIILPVKLRYLIRPWSRTACSVFFICLAVYLAWIAQLFFRDSFGAVNYTTTLLIVRFVALAAGVAFFTAVLRCDGSLYAAQRPTVDDHPHRRSTD